MYEISKLDSKKITAYASATSKSKIKSPGLRLFALYENLTRFVMPLCSSVPGRANPESPVDQSTNIVDLSKVGLKQLWNLRSHMQEASTLATAHYPEVLDRIFVSSLSFSSSGRNANMTFKIIGAPSFFPVVWGWVKKWFDPITTSKIFLLAQQDVLPTLSSFIDIEDIPKRYGGNLDFDFGKLPNLDPKIRQHLSIESTENAETLFVASPIRWVNEDKSGLDGEMTALSVGTVDGKQRKERVAVLHSLATRVATHSSNFQSQRTEITTLPSRPATPNSQAALQTSQSGSISNGHPAPPAATSFIGQLPPQSQPVSNGHATSQSHIQPAPATNISAASLHDQPIPDSAPLRHPSTNGGPPESKPQNITMPPPPIDIERTKTDFFTPPSDPIEAKRLQ